ncbi:hypothetical protein [Thalassospira marina]|uniref:hypothetical protein n=1 Tax=Thalassospira marina TaxID=2048283 RepID=UPI001C06E75C|nr:hypothetical protein [Thalassospira marina]
MDKDRKKPANMQNPQGYSYTAPIKAQGRAGVRQNAIHGNFAIRGAANWLHLAASPVFAILGVMAAFDDGPMASICNASGNNPFFAGMNAMYFLMALFHLPPWLHLILGSGNTKC